jgi:hypothetical protein
MIATVALVMGGSLGTLVAAPAVAAPTATVTGTWHLHTTDCFFGVCRYTLQLTQTGDLIFGPAGSGIRGHLNGSIMAVGLHGRSEDDWTCRGTVNASLTVLYAGTFVDGTGGSGTCGARKVTP